MTQQSQHVGNDMILTPGSGRVRLQASAGQVVVVTDSDERGIVKFTIHDDGNRQLAEAWLNSERELVISLTRPKSLARLTHSLS